MNLINKDELIAKDIKYQIFVNNKDILTSERQLAEKYNVSRNTIRDALKTLLNEHLIEKNNNRYVIAQPKEDFDTDDILGIKNKYELNNKILNIQDLEANKKTAREIRQPLGTKIKHIKYIRYLFENVPISIDDIIIPQSIINEDEWRLSTNSVIQLIHEKISVPINREYQQLNIVPTSDIGNIEFTSSISSDSVLVRKSLFLSNNSSFFTLLTSYKNPDYCLLTQPNKKIFSKVGGFDE